MWTGFRNINNSKYIAFILSVKFINQIISVILVINLHTIKLEMKKQCENFIFVYNW